MITTAGVVWGALLAVMLMGIVYLLRLRQYARSCKSVLQDAQFPFPGTSVIFLMDYYRGSDELEQRICKTLDLFWRLEAENKNPIILGAIGKLKGEARALADVNKDELIRRNIPRNRIVSYLGKDGKGAADTFVEVRLACEYLKAQSQRSAYVVANFPQACDAFFLGLYHGIFLQPYTVDITCLAEKPDYLIGRLFLRPFVLFDPNGRNPFSMFMRYRRRYISNEQ